MLPDHTADTLSTWLAEHPGVEIICRDGSTAYAGGKCVVCHRDSLQEPALVAAAPMEQPAQVSPPRESGPAVRTSNRFCNPTWATVG